MALSPFDLAGFTVNQVVNLRIYCTAKPYKRSKKLLAESARSL
jgi:hypothetical protein